MPMHKINMCDENYNFPIVCVVLALDSWNYCSRE